jgi:O-acetyl-ADP-ribose deacetylase (regulator of RNase III)
MRRAADIQEVTSRSGYTREERSIMSEPKVPDPQPVAFEFGTTTVDILFGNILSLEVDVDFLVSTDDNYLTMASGVAGALRKHAGPGYVAEAQKSCPVKAGTVVVTCPHDLKVDRPRLKRVLHGAVIDYDTEALPLEQLVYGTTANCLEKAEQLVRELGQETGSILFPAFAAGSGKLSMEACSRQMCGAIKAYLAIERPLKSIRITLFLGDAATPERKADIQSFIDQAELVLGVPYNPALGIRQTRDPFPRAEEIESLWAVVNRSDEDKEEHAVVNRSDEDKEEHAVVNCSDKGKKHAVILGGPRIGKQILLDRLYEQAQGPDSPLREGRRLVKLSFGRVHENTPVSFIYQKLLSALEAVEQDEDVRRDIKQVYADLANPANQKPGDSSAKGGDERDACDLFLDFLECYLKRYAGEVVFLVDHLPQLMDMESEEGEKFQSVRAFWSDIDRLADQGVRFVYTARDSVQYQRLLSRLSLGFQEQLQEIRLACVSSQDRKAWVAHIFERYIGRKSVPPGVMDFIDQEAGYHPYLISLAGYALIEAIKRDQVRNPRQHPRKYDGRTLEPFFREARYAIDGDRRGVFDQLMEHLPREHKTELDTLAQAVAAEEEFAELWPDLAEGQESSPAYRRSMELRGKIDYRGYLHQEILRELEDWGYLVNVEQPARGRAARIEPRTAQFVARPFWLYVQDYFRTRRWTSQVERPKDVVITLLRGYRDLSAYARSSAGSDQASDDTPAEAAASREPGSPDRASSHAPVGTAPVDSTSAASEARTARPQPTRSDWNMIWTMLRSRGARVITAQNPLSPEVKSEFMRGFDRCVRYHLDPVKDREPEVKKDPCADPKDEADRAPAGHTQPDRDRAPEQARGPGVFRNFRDVGSYILTQFTTVAIKRYLRDLPQGSTILLMVDDALRDIPWELMLETAYAGEIPFRVGRLIVSPEHSPVLLPPERGQGKVKALLIADPTAGEQNRLEMARREVCWLAGRLRRDEHFAEPDILIGPENCQRIRILNHLASGEYGLVHYSGHSRYLDEQSAWQVGDGDITTDQLTNAMQIAPPALVFSSSCESAEASGSQAAQYESQAYDLPSAFLQAGVEAYVGALWKVSQDSARRFVEEFYTVFLGADCELGECLRRAKWACKRAFATRDPVHWLPFVLYGDPHTRPGDLFPAMGQGG